MIQSPPAVQRRGALRRRPRSWLRAGLVLLLVLLGIPAWAAPPVVLELRDELHGLNGWPAVRVLKDPLATLTAAEALARLDQFIVPRGPQSNIGPQQGAVWLAVPLRVPAGHSGQWLMAIEYAALQRVDAVVVQGNDIGPPFTMGTLVPRSQWPVPGRIPLVPLALTPGVDHTVLLRVQSSGGMVVPIRLMRPTAYHQSEERFQAVQGVISGLVLFLLLYSLTQWAVLRDPMYLDYALGNIGLILMFQTQFGLGPQHLWPHSEWFTRHAGPVSVLIGMVGIFRFIARWLAEGGAHRVLLAGLRAGSALAALVLVVFMVDLIDYRLALLLSSLIAPVPMLAALPSAWRRARAGSRQARYMFLGWGCYAVGAVTLTALVRGAAPANAWTQHMHQVCAVAEMGFFMAVLALRVQEMRQAAERVQREHADLQTLAHTDPLTGLLNRRGLDLVLEGVVRQSRPESLTAVYLLDLDGFKPVNDRWGHDVGDALLVSVGASLKSMVRASDAVARVGGDEFVVVVSSLRGDEEAARLGQKLLDCFAAARVVQGHACRVGVTIGYALAPLDGFDAASLLKRADAAMYGGKQAGRHCVRRGGATAGLADAEPPRQRLDHPPAHRQADLTRQR